MLAGKARKQGKFVRLFKALGRELAIFGRGIVPAGHVFVDARGFDHAAAISFYFILSMAPFTILFFSAIGFVAAKLGPDSIQVSSVIERITAVIRDFVPVEGDTLRGILDYLIARRGQFGIAGTAVMILGASAVFGALENAQTDIFDKGARRKYIISRLIFTVVLFFAGMLVFLTYNAKTLFDSFIAVNFGSSVDQVVSRTGILSRLFDYIPVPIGFLAVLYLPGIVRPRFPDAMRGAVLFFVLWEIAREGYSYYVTSVAEYNLLYGSLATPILLILWLFYSALILIYCLSFTAAIAAPKPRKL